MRFCRLFDFKGESPRGAGPSWVPDVVEQRPDPVVGEAAEPEPDSFDAFDEIVDRRVVRSTPGSGRRATIRVYQRAMARPSRSTSGAGLVLEVTGASRRVYAFGEFGVSDLVDVAEGFSGVPGRFSRSLCYRPSRLMPSMAAVM